MEEVEEFNPHIQDPFVRFRERPRMEKSNESNQYGTYSTAGYGG
jgi:hypothetical protein